MSLIREMWCPAHMAHHNSLPQLCLVVVEPSSQKWCTIAASHLNNGLSSEETLLPTPSAHSNVGRGVGCEGSAVQKALMKHISGGHGPEWFAMQGETEKRGQKVWLWLW